MAGLRPLRSTYVEAAPLLGEGEKGALREALGTHGLSVWREACLDFLTKLIGVNPCESGTHLYTAVSVVALYMCRMVDLGASLAFVISYNALVMLETPLGRREETELTRCQTKRLASIRIELV